jgi:hypothetical protein
MVSDNQRGQEEERKRDERYRERCYPAREMGKVGKNWISLRSGSKGLIQPSLSERLTWQK